MKILKWYSIQRMWRDLPSKEMYEANWLYTPYQEFISELQSVVNSANDKPLLIPNKLLDKFCRFDLPIKRNQIYFVWVYKEFLYLFLASDHEISYSPDQQQLLIQGYYRKEQNKWEKLKRASSIENENTKPNLCERIPDEIKIAVWRRDEGKCARCGSREKLEYDHIIPVSLGGSNTIRNIELLCEKCNREKSNNIC